MTTAEELAANAQKRAQDEKNNAASLTGDGLPVAQENAESTTQSGYANKLNRQVARGEIDQGQADVLLKNSPPEMAGPSAPAPAPAQNQAPSAPANTNGMGVDTNDGGRIVSYGRQMARYDKNGNIVGWSDANGNAVETPKSMQMVSGVQPDKGDFPDVRSAQEWARKNREQKRVAVADKNIEIAKFAGVALEAAHRDGKTVTSKSGEKYMMGVVPTEQIKSLNDKLSAMGKHTVEKIGAFQRLNAEGRPVGEPQFVIRYKQNGAESAAGKSVFRQLSKTDLLNGLKESYDAKGDAEGLAKYEKDTFRDYAGEIKAEKQAEEDRARKIQSENNAMHTALLKALGDAGMGMGTRDTVRGVANDQKLMESLRYVDRVVYEKDANGNIVKDANGQPKPMVDSVTNVTITEKIPLSDEQVLARVAQFKNRNGGGGGEVGFLNSYVTGADIPQKVAEMALRNLGYETPKMRQEAQAAQTQTQRSLEDIQGIKAELLRLKAQRGGGAQAPSAPAPAATAPAAPQNPNPAPQPTAQTQFVPQEQPQGGVQNIVADLSRQTFAEPNPAAQKPYPTAQAQTNPSPAPASAPAAPQAQTAKDFIGNRRMSEVVYEIANDIAARKGFGDYRNDASEWNDEFKKEVADTARKVYQDAGYGEFFDKNFSDMETSEYWKNGFKDFGGLVGAVANRAGSVAHNVKEKAVDLFSWDKRPGEEPQYESLEQEYITRGAGQKSASPYLQQMREDEESKRQTRPGNRPRPKQGADVKNRLAEAQRRGEDEREYRKWVEDKNVQREQEHNQPVPETRAQKTVSEISRLEGMARGFDKDDPLHDIMAEFADDLAKRIKKIEDINKSANAEADKLVADMG